ncbi:MAG: hypothetical protein Q8920_05180 [Bacillota bacterium]|nr:hypothetical protein [Bacillota bacterium]
MNKQEHQKKSSRLSIHDKVVLSAYADKTIEADIKPAEENFISEKNTTYRNKMEMLKRG